ncbi:5252_t:CDS:2 [Diversispora eburnea]|uniref:5252_t:CDS:1 n=1 Tax=Diversispora eburnea TaxID=1213867 RepID=A0A9N8WC69_9GLOM|nr:5252_t:CDS:2 [Diversispora eburnea]
MGCKYPFLHWRRLCYNDAWCKCDARRLTKGWTSGHLGLDKFIKETQRSTREWMDPYLVWIPYEQLSNIKEIGEGGFSITYSAEWCDMAKRFSWAATDKPRPVALRLIKNSKDMSTSFLDELRVYHQCISNPPMFDGEVKYDHGFLRFFGFTQHPETEDYLMVTELAPCPRDLLYMFNHWWDITQDPEILDDIFSNADKFIPALDNNFTKHPEAIYTSRLINFKRLLNKGKEDNNKEN